MAFKVLVVDDDEGVRLLLKKIIIKSNGFEWIGEAEDGEAALRFFESARPDIIFLDVEMPKLNGVECAKRIAELDPKTFFIFVTAHEEYMQDAFSVYAADYLVKPFKVERVEQTLERIRDAHQPKSETKHPPREIIRREKGLDRLLIKNKEAVHLLDMKDIALIQREDRNTVVYTADNRYLTSDTLNELEERLDKSLFFRCHKSYIINLSMIKEIYPYGRWTYLVKLKNTGRDALLTYEKYGELEKIFI
jgi:two-component system LytT family response regulator